MTIDEMRAVLKGLGIQRAFKTTWESETESIAIQTRKAGVIVDGELRGLLVLSLFRFRLLDGPLAPDPAP